ncbi:MAG: energy-coupling factor transporter transmembrane protein EcfT [Firmicutes bacterium]|nr:energy-coupling factor transporter transmembrane protein EcfT [Bacillota bacterium]
MSVGAGFITGQYYPIDSPVHRTDPRVKLLLILFYAVAIFFIKNFTGLVVMTILIGVFVYISRLPVGLALKGVKPLFYILVLTLLIQLWVGGGPWVAVGPVNISIPGLRDGIFIDIRLVLLIVGASFLTLTSTPVELTDAIEYLLTPLKRLGAPSHELAMMMTIALRFIPILSVEADKIIKAQASRGARFNSKNPIAKFRSFIPILIPLFVSVFRRADELAEAMEARAYRGGEGRTRMRELKMKNGDWIGFIVVNVLFAVLIYIGRLPIV